MRDNGLRNVESLDDVSPGIKIKAEHCLVLLDPFPLSFER